MFPVSFLALVLFKINQKNIFSSSSIWAIFFLYTFKLDYIFSLVFNEKYPHSFFNSIILISLTVFIINIMIIFSKSDLIKSLNKGLVKAMIINSIQSILFNLKPLNLFFPIIDSDLKFSFINYVFKTEKYMFLIFFYYFIELILMALFRYKILKTLILKKVKSQIISNFNLIGKINRFLYFFVLLGFSFVYFYRDDFILDIFILSSFYITACISTTMFILYTLTHIKND